MKTSRHANKRIQQRGIPSSAIDLALLFSTPTFNKGRGSLSYTLTSRNIAEARTYIGRLMNDLDHLKNRTIVTDESTSKIITVY
jgi:cell division protein FtsB